MNWTDVPQLLDLKIDFPRFEAELYALTNRLGILPEAFLIDHIAVRCHQNVTAQRWYQGFSQCGHLLHEAEINGRRIALFELTTPLNLRGQAIPCIELPWPGERRYPHEGWEHVEIVLPGEADTLFARALTLLSDEALASTSLRIKQSQPQARAETLANPTLAVSDGRVTVKFHPYALRDIVSAGRPE
ncbi:VOC family protein [Candidatus Sodalis sp. SoCistrobi]|uniref:VOC family protein n=1 Tax=Candidatus Sodalis sp. SoCistrobi TaxID=1922216 RepID=UPI00093D8192|nr:VOC family protein [Candidatus Sodalis sp. SoCistrobi]